jgi:3-hydroxyacyl-[acyl-carrier-protein] dehydratase
MAMYRGDLKKRKLLYAYRSRASPASEPILGFGAHIRDDVRQERAFSRSFSNSNANMKGALENERPALRTAVSHCPDETIALGTAGLERILPHRYPMLLLDRVQQLSTTRARGYKNVSANEPCFSEVVVSYPNTLVIEAMAQLGGLLVVTPVDYRRKMAHLAGIIRARFRGVAVAGDRLQMDAALIRLRGTAGWVRVATSVDGRALCLAQLTYTIFDVVL